MASISHSSANRFERGVWWAAALLVSLFCTAVQLSITAPYRLTSFARMTHFTAVEPFQHRVLIPALAAAIEHLAPLGPHLVFGLLEVVAWMALIMLAYRAVERFGIAETEALKRLLALSIVLPLAIVVLMPDLRVWPLISLDGGTLDLGNWSARTLFYYPYDLPAAAFTLALLLAVADWGDRPEWRRLGGFAILFALATVNRETTLFVIPMAALMLAGRLPMTRFAALLGLMLALYAAVEWPLHWLFSNQPNPHAALGDTQYELHITENLRLLSHPAYLLTEPVRFVGGCWLVVVLWWRCIDRRLRAAILGLAVPLILVGIVVGRIAEHRIFIEAVPLFWLAGLQAIRGRLAAEAAPPQ
ncbi:hypothetical protein ACS8Y6_01755 [Salinisphaera sp. RV14]|uniref:hypothetical protein n=1 Tax=Salinisphaera sp. RV14 TaxID=3454140 RepID=UPI003F84BB9E